MNTPNPLMPQGALEAQATNKRSMVQIVVGTIVAIHVVGLGGLLFLGCKEEAPLPKTTFTGNGLAGPDPINSVDEDYPFGGLDLPDTSDAPPIPGGAGEGGTTIDTPPIQPGFVGNGGFDIPPTDPDPRDGGLAGAGNFQPEPEPIPPVVEEMKKYVILPNDNYYKIADKHNLKVNDISRANPGVDPRKLQVGDELNLPPNVRAVPPVVPESGGQYSTSETTHKVKSGETLTRISKRYGVSIPAIQKANGLKGDKIRVGQKLVIPVPTN